MNNNLFYRLLLIFSLTGLTALAQNNNHIGEWKLVAQKLTAANGQMFQGDSTNIFQRKILTSDNQFIVLGERVVNGQRLVVSAHGGYYTLNGNTYIEKLNYAAHQGFDKWKSNYLLTVEGDKMHQVGTLDMGNGILTTYDETYVRVKH